MMKSANPVPRFSHMTIDGDGAVALPARLHGKFISIDPLHHHLIASERRMHGSTFSTVDVGYPLRTKDETFRPVYLTHSPDGSVTIADFREEYIAHGQNMIVLRGFDGVDVSIPRSEIGKMRAAGRSMMPDGLLDDLTDQQLRDFLAYLRIPQPISP